MPKIKLKRNSPEYEDEEPQEVEHIAMCDMPDCDMQGLHRSPKDRSLGEYYRFCDKHAGEYNQAWNYFDGLTAEQEKEHMRKSQYGDKPTWKKGTKFETEEELLRAAGRMYGAKTKPKKRPTSPQLSPNSPEGVALKAMDLYTPITLDEIKIRYRELAKIHHPDKNGGCKEAEEKLKTINMSYTILKLAWGRWEELKRKNL